MQQTAVLVWIVRCCHHCQRSGSQGIPGPPGHFACQIGVVQEFDLQLKEILLYGVQKGCLMFAISFLQKMSALSFSIDGIINSCSTLSSSLDASSNQRLSCNSKLPRDPTPDDPETKGFACKVCGKVFTAHYNLTRHMPTHTGARPFICKVSHIAIATGVPGLSLVGAGEC